MSCPVNLPLCRSTIDESLQNTCDVSRVSRPLHIEGILHKQEHQSSEAARGPVLNWRIGSSLAGASAVAALESLRS